MDPRGLELRDSHVVSIEPVSQMSVVGISVEPLDVIICWLPMAFAEGRLSPPTVCLRHSVVRQTGCGPAIACFQIPRDDGAGGK